MARDPKPGDTAGDKPLSEDELREQPVSALREEAAERDLVVDGSGKGGAVVKEDLVDAIATADAIAEPAGRPPLADVAQQAAQRDAENATDMRDSDTSE